MNYFPEKPWNTGDTFVNDTTNVTYRYDGVKWVPVSNDADLGDFVEKAGDTMTGRLNLKYDYTGLGLIDLGGSRFIRSNGNRPTGNAVDSFFDVWHLDAADATTNPENEFKVQWDGAQDFIDNNPNQPFALIVDDGGSSQVWITTDTGWVTPGNTWHISAAQVLPPTEEYSGVLRADRPVNLYIYGSDNTVDMPYATVLESAVIAAGVAQHVIDQNGDDGADYLPLTGGTLQRVGTGGYLLEANKLDSNRLFSVFTSSAGQATSDVTEYWKAPGDITKPFEITTKSYVDLAIASSGSGSSQVAFTYTQSNLAPDSGNVEGKFGLTDAEGNSTLDFNNAKVIWFSATDFDGNKPFHSWDRDVSIYAPGPLYLLRNDEMQWMLQGGAAAGANVNLEYSKDLDVFLLFWTGTTVSARLSAFSGLTNGGLYNLYIPNLNKI